MKIGMKIKSLILLFVAFCLSIVFGVVSFGDVKRVSGESENVVSSELFVAGASLRYVDGNNGAAARYHVTISESLYEDTVAQGRETGILVIPNALLGGKELNLDTTGAKPGVFSNESVNHWFMNTDGEYEARAFVGNIPAKNYGTKLAVVAYAETAQGYVYSELYNTSSLSAIALAEVQANPDGDNVDSLIDTYATFGVTINGTQYDYVYGETIPFASALGLADANNTDRKWSANGKVTGPVSLQTTATGVDIGAQELDLDVNADGSENTSQYIDFDISSLNAGSLTLGTDYTLNSVTVGETVISDTTGAYVENNKLFLPASLIDVSTWGEQDVTLTFTYNGININVTANDSLVVTKKLSDATELKAFLTIADAVADDVVVTEGSTGRTWGGYFQLDADVDLNTTDLFDNGGFSTWTNNMDRQEGDDDTSYSEGFVGVFDGCGYAINGLAVKSTAFIDVIGANGTLKNVAFTNAVVSSVASVVTEQNNGLVENVYVHMYDVGGWFNDSGTGLGKTGAWYNAGWTGGNTTIINNSWMATGTLSNVFIDLSDSAKANAEGGSIDGQSWHDDENGFRILGLSVNTTFDGVYMVGVPETGTWATTSPNGIINNIKASATASKTANRWWSTDEATFITVYNENAEIKAKVDTWPVFMKDKLGLVDVQTLTARQEINLDVQVNNTTKVVTPSTGTATISLAEAKAFNSIERVTFNGNDIGFKLDGTDLILDVADFDYAYGEGTLAVTTDKMIVNAPVHLVTKVLKTKADVQDFGYIAKACEADTKLWGGYFKLGNDIEFYGTATQFVSPSTSTGLTGDGLSWGWGSAGGFAGTFDGDGHKIIGLNASNWNTGESFIPVLNTNGVIKNVAFTEGKLGFTGGFVTFGGSGLIENVYVQLDAFKNPVNDPMGVFFSQPNGSDCAMKVKNCLVEVAEDGFAATNVRSEELVKGGLIASVGKFGWNSTDGYTGVNEGPTFSGSFDHVYVVGDVNGEFKAFVAHTDEVMTAMTDASSNVAVYAGVDAFVQAYATDNQLAYTFDYLNELFGIALNDKVPAFGTADEGEIDLDVTVEEGVAVVNTTTKTFNVSAVADDLTEFVSLSYNGAEAITSGVTVNGAKVTVPVAGQIAPTSYTETASYNLTLVAKNANGKQYTITIPTSLVTKVITTKDELTSFLTIADAVAKDDDAETAYEEYYGTYTISGKETDVQAIGNQGKWWGGYFKLGNDIVFNDMEAFQFQTSASVWSNQMNPHKDNNFINYVTSGGTSGNVAGDQTWNNGFKGIFDGCGYSIEGLLTYQNGFIDIIAEEGVLKNVAFIDAIFTGTSLLSNENHGTIENIYAGVYALGGWSNASGYYTKYNKGTCGTGTGIVNNGTWFHEGTVGTLSNVFVDLTKSAHVNDLETNASAGLSWHDDADGPVLYGLVLPTIDGVYTTGVPTGTTWSSYKSAMAWNTAITADKGDDFRWYEGNADFVSAYLENAEINANVNAWPVWLKELAGAVETVDGGDLNLDVQVDTTAKEVSLNGEEVAIPLSKALGGELVSVKMGEEALGSARIDGETLYIPAEEFGYNYGERTLNVKTTEDLLNVDVFLITKEIKTKADLDGFGLIAKQVRSDNDKMWGGYFRLANDIEYNASWTTFIAVSGAVAGNSTGAGLGWNYSAGGFEGVFDGNNHKLIGMTFGGWVDSTTQAFIGSLKGGTVKDVAFTNTTLKGSGAVVTLGGEGTIENVFVHYTKFTAAKDYYTAGDTASNTEGPGTFFSQVAGDKTVDCAITLKNCFVDLSEASLNSYTVAGVVGTLSKWQGGTTLKWQGAKDYTGTMTNVYTVGTTAYPAIYMNDSTIVTAEELGNTTVYADETAFSKAYYTDTTVRATYDMLNAKFGINLNVQDLTEIDVEVEDAQTLNLDVTTEYSNWEPSAGTLTYGAPTAQATAFTLDLDTAEAEGIEFAEVSNVALVGKATRSGGAGTLTGVTLADSHTVSIPVAGNFDATDYFDGYMLTLTATTESGKPYNFTFTDVDLVSMVIEDKADLEAFGPVALAIGSLTGTPFAPTQTNDTAGTADGYFVLGNDIDFGGTSATDTVNYFKPFIMRRVTMSSDAHGFAGIFDGRNYKIENLIEYAPAGEGGFITAIGERGILRNVSFTNAYFGGGSASFIAWRGKGLCENVYVQYATNGWSSSASGNVSTFFGYVTAGSSSGMAEARLVNCFVDFSNVDMNKIFVPWGNTDDETRTEAEGNDGMPIDLSSGVTGMVAKVMDTASINGVYSIGLQDGIVRSTDRFNDYVYNYASTAIVDARNTTTATYLYRVKNGDVYSWAEKTGVILANSPDGTTVTSTIGAFDDNGMWGNWATAQDMADAYNAKGSLIRAMLSTWDADVWKIVGGVPSPKYASTSGVAKVDLDLVPVYDDATGVLLGATPNNGRVSFAISDIKTNFGTLVSATYGETDLSATFNASTCELTVDATVFGTAYGEDTITLTFADEYGKEHTFSIGVLLISKTISNDDELDQMGKIAKACEFDNDKAWGGYFVFDDDFTYDNNNGVYTPFIDVSTGTTVSTLPTTTYNGYYVSNGNYVYDYSAGAKLAVGDTEYGTLKVSTGTGQPLNWAYATAGTGFIGVIDGQGHAITGLGIAKTWSVNSFVSANNGTVKNLAFVDAVKKYYGGYVASGGSGTIENVYVKYSTIAPDSNSGDGAGTFFAQPNGGTLSLNLINCFVDASVEIASNGGYFGVVGSVAKNNTGVTTCNGSFNGVYAIYGANTLLRDTSTAQVVNAVWNPAVTAGTAGGYATQADFVTAYNEAGTLRDTVNAYPDWMKTLVFAGATGVVEEPSLDLFLANYGKTEYTIIVGDLNDDMWDAMDYIRAVVKEQTDANLKFGYASEWTAEAKYIVLNDWDLFNQAFSTESPLSSSGASYGVFSKGNTVFVMAEDSSDISLATIKFLYEVLGYRQYSGDGRGTQVTGREEGFALNQLADGTLVADIEGFGDYLKVASADGYNYVELNLSTNPISFVNEGMFDYRQAGPFTTMNVDGEYSMGLKEYNQFAGEWHNLTGDNDLVPASQAYVVDGTTYNAYDSSVTTHPWYATDGSATYTSGEIQVCFTAHGNATAYAHLVKVYGDAIIRLANNNPKKGVMLLTTEDNSNACTCSSCTAFGSAAATYLNFVNDVEQYVNNGTVTLPGGTITAEGTYSIAGEEMTFATLDRSTPVRIGYFAYSAYQTVPYINDGIEIGGYARVGEKTMDANHLTQGGNTLNVLYPNTNTLLILAPGGAISDTPINEGRNLTENWREGFSANWYDMEVWLDITKAQGTNIYLWSYELMQGDWFLSRNSFESTVANYRIFAENGNMEVMSTENVWSKANATAFSALKAYINAQALMEVNKYVEIDETTLIVDKTSLNAYCQKLIDEFFGIERDASGKIIVDTDGTFSGKGYYGEGGAAMYKLYLEYRAAQYLFTELDDQVATYMESSSYTYKSSDFGTTQAHSWELDWNQLDLTASDTVLNAQGGVTLGSLYWYSDFTALGLGVKTDVTKAIPQHNKSVVASSGKKVLGSTTYHFYVQSDAVLYENDDVSNINRWLGYVYSAYEAVAGNTVYEKHILVESLMPRWIATGGLLWAGSALGVQNGAFAKQGTATTGSAYMNNVTDSTTLKDTYYGDGCYEGEDVTPDGLYGYVVEGTKWFTGNWNTTDKPPVTWYFGYSETASSTDGYTASYTATIPVGDGTMNGYTTTEYAADNGNLAQFRRDFLMDAKMLGYENYASGKGTNLMYVEHANRYLGNYQSGNYCASDMLWISETSNRVFGVVNFNTYY